METLNGFQKFFMFMGPLEMAHGFNCINLDFEKNI